MGGNYGKVLPLPRKSIEKSTCPPLFLPVPNCARYMDECKWTKFQPFLRKSAKDIYLSEISTAACQKVDIDPDLCS